MDLILDYNQTLKDGIYSVCEKYITERDKNEEDIKGHVQYLQTTFVEDLKNVLRQNYVLADIVTSDIKQGNTFVSAIMLPVNTEYDHTIYNGTCYKVLSGEEAPHIDKIRQLSEIKHTKASIMALNDSVRLNIYFSPIIFASQFSFSDIDTLPDTEEMTVMFYKAITQGLSTYQLSAKMYFILRSAIHYFYQLPMDTPRLEALAEMRDVIYQGLSIDINWCDDGAITSSPEGSPASIIDQSKYFINMLNAFMSAFPIVDKGSDVLVNDGVCQNLCRKMTELESFFPSDEIPDELRLNANLIWSEMIVAVAHKQYSIPKNPMYLGDLLVTALPYCDNDKHIETNNSVLKNHYMNTRSWMSHFSSKYNDRVQISCDAVSAESQLIQMHTFFPEFIPYPDKRFAMERVAFQPKSKLASGLIAVVQKFIDYKDAEAAKLGGEKEAFSGRKSRKTLLSKCDQYFTDTTKEEIIKVIKNTVNVTISKIESLGCESQAAYFAMCPDNADVYVQSIENMEGRIGGYIPRAKGGAMLAEINSLFDPQNSKIKKNNIRDLSMTLYLSPGAMLFNDAGIGLIGDGEKLTAAESAAIIIHEVGHYMSFIEMCNNRFFAYRHAQETINYVLENGTDEEKSALLKKTGEYYTKHRKEFDLPDTEPETTTKANVVTEIMLMKLINEIMYVISDYHRHMVAVMTTGDTRKLTDAYATSTTFRNEERRADEFASMHGLGGDIVTALRKVTKPTLDRVGTTGVFYLFLKLVLWFMIWQYFTRTLGREVNYMGNMRYGPDKERFTRVLRDQFNILKDQNLDPKVRDSIMAQAETVMRTLAQMNSPTVINTARKISEMINYVLNYDGGDTNMVERLMNGNLTAAYKYLQDITEGAIKNPLYYQAARAKRIIDQKTL